MKGIYVEGDLSSISFEPSIVSYTIWDEKEKRTKLIKHKGNVTTETYV